MLTIKENIVNETIINKSRFITFLYKCDDVLLVSNLINNVKEEFKGATHYCYAYIINSHEKASDDGEPGGAAGLPILSVLKKNDVSNVLCIVVRYFGGVKLGSGGLIRAYSNSVRDALVNCELVEIKDMINVLLVFDYEAVDKVDYLLKGIDIVKDFGEVITYRFLIDALFDMSEIDNIVKEKRIL